jgi:uncharacterized protein (DUF433 family)
MRVVCFGLGLVLIGVVAFTSPVRGRGVRCEDIARERARGKSANEVAQALGTTRARIAACTQLDADRERHADHQARVLERQARRHAAD